MISTEDLSRLLFTLYSAPLEPHKWQEFFDHLSRMTNISSGYLMVDDKSQGHLALAGGGSAFNSEAIRVYNDYYVQVDPFVAPTLQRRSASVIRGEKLVSRSQLLATEFYNDFLRNREMEFMTLLSCSIGEHTDVMPIWHRKQDGPMDEVSIALLEALLPHVKTALQTRRILQGASVQSEFAELALEGVAAAVLLVSGDGNVLHMNKLASALVHKGDGLRLKGLSLTAWNTDDNARLSVLIARCASAQRNGLSPAPGGALEISRQETQHPLHVAVLPLPESSRSHIVVPGALVFISDPSISPKLRGDLLRVMYGLNPTESRLADLLLQGHEVRQAAEHMRNTLETTRFHLKRVFAKTGTRRQSELIRLMLSLPGE